MLTDETNPNTSSSIESACLPIGCSVSAKYRGAFCSAEVKTVERQVKLKVTLFDTGETVFISEEQIVHPVSLRIGNTVVIRLSSSTNSRSGLASLINSSDNYDKKKGTIKQIYDNSIYTVVFNDGDEKSLRRSSLCLQGIRLYQTHNVQEKLLEDIPSTSSSSTTTTTTARTTLNSKNETNLSSIVAIHRHGSNNQHAFPALILKRKSLADYIWVKSFLDGREYIVHKRDDVQIYKNNSQIQTLCRLTSKQATQACEKFIKYNQIPMIWQKKKKKQINNEQDYNNDSNTSDSDVDDSDEEITEKKDSFVAQLFAFMDDRGTSINNIPKIHNYDLDLHRLFKIVRMLGGYNKVTKNDQWGKVYIKMGLPDESTSKNNRTIENAYKKYLFAYEDLSKKLGTMNAPNAYLGGRTSMNGDSRRGLIRVRQESEDKKSTPFKQQSSKRLSIDSKQNLSTTKTPLRRKPIIIKPSTATTSESETSDDEILSNNNNKLKKQPLINSKRIISTIKKPPIITDEKKKFTRRNNSSSTDSRSSSTPMKKLRSTNDTQDTMKPIIKIQKISYEILMESTLAIHKHTKKQKDNKSLNLTTSEHEKSNIDPSISEPIKQSLLQNLTPLQVTPVSPSPPPSITDETPPDTPSIFQSINHEQINQIDKSNKRPYDHEQFSPSKRSRHSLSSEDNNEKSDIRLKFEDISINDILLVKFDFNQKKQYSGKCIEKDQKKKQLFIHYQDLDSKYDEWIDLDRIIQRQNQIDLNDEEKILPNDSDNGIWKSILNEDIYPPSNTQKYFQNSNGCQSISKSTEDILRTSDNLLHSLPINEEIIDSSSTTPQSTPIFIEPIAPCLLSISLPNSPLDNRRTSIRQQKRRTFRDPKDLSISTKKRNRLDIDINSNFHHDSTNNSDISPTTIEQQQQSVDNKRCRTVGKRNGKKTINQQDNDNEDCHLNSPINGTVRQQLEDMFKHRSSRYNFLHLNNNLTGENRLTHLKDRMHQCQKAFFNLKTALTKIEKQRKIFLRRQKLSTAQPTTNDLLLPSTCI